jgi:cytochrome P450
MSNPTGTRTVDGAPSSTVDLWSDEVLRDPYPTYAALRALGPVVYLDGYDLWAVTRHDLVRRVLADHIRFTSTQGIGLNDDINGMGQGILASDPPEHDVMKQVLAEHLSPRGVGRIQDQVQDEADELVATTVARGSFDAVADLAEKLPVSIVAGLVGIGPQDRGPLLGFAESAFSSWGPPNARTSEHLPNMKAFLRYTVSQAGRHNLAPGGWGMAAYEAADRGEISADTAIELLGAYLGAGMDTTISAISSAIMLFARNPEQWNAVRDDPALLGAAFSEVLRIESPIQMFSRVATTDVDVEDVRVPAGGRLLVMYGCANRDERHYPDPDRFDVRRRPSDHVAFGYGLHTCAGHFLARSQTVAVLRALTAQVARIHADPPVYQLNNITRRIGSLPVSVETVR